MKKTPALARLIASVDREMLASIENRKPAMLYEPMHYLFESGGKRLRPLLLILSCKVLGGTLESCLPAAVAVEMIHNYTLIHDDIMDHDDLRRGRQTIHTRWDEATGILAGDGLLSLGYQTLLKTESEKNLTLVKLLTDGLLIICEGQALDKTYESENSISLEAYSKMIAYKTAKLLEVACEMGTVIGNGSSGQRDAIRRFAFGLGMAFQIRDDLHDITKKESVSGKTYGSDITEKKKTFLTVSFLQEARPEDKAVLMSIWEKKTIGRQDLERVRSLFEKNGILKRAGDAVRDYVADSLSHLAVFPDSEDKQMLVMLADTVRSDL